jgi:two-component system, NtrC family, nitrogen regulation sensor histidine kinase NtrY
MQSKSADLTDMPSRTALTRLGGAMRVVAFLAALGSILATFLLVTGLVNIQLTERTAIILVAATAGVALVLGAVVAFDLIRLFSQFRRGQAGARLHLRIVGLFTLIAAVPAILIAIVASITIERGLNPWFSGALRELVTNAGTIAEGYQQQLCQNVGREMRLMAEDIDRAKRVGLYEQDRPTFKSFVTSRAVMLGFPYAVLIKADGTIIERADTKSPEEPQPPREQDFKDAETSEQPCLLTARHVGALIRVPSFEGAYLFVARQVDQRAIAFGQVAEQAVEQYRLLDAQRENVQRAFAIMYAIITLMLLLSAIWLGIAFADRLVAPIRRLITATDAVSAGNLYVQVPIQKSEGDIGHLGQTFNNMIAEIRGQQNRIVSASETLDRRRQFTEAVLSGVSVGVIGLDDAGQIAIANPVAESIMGRELAGRRLADVSEEIDQLFQEARRSRSGGFQRQVDLSAGGRERTLFVRVTSEKAAAADRRGFVVTIDDISDLVTAQRTSAWADVARRIAHEIKNPLTPIQLSAERIRRKYGRVIVQDREVFEQCTDTIIRQVDDIRRMVDEFSSFARMPKPQPEQEDLVETLRQTLFMMRVGNPAISFTDNLPAGPVLARFDRRLIGQAVQNVLKNGVEGIAARQDAAPGPGRIALKLWAVEQHGLAIDIIDNGVGFPTENRQRLLEPYMTTREGGTGLGLPIVAKIFEEHGGGIELFDNPDGERGAMVRLTLAIEGPGDVQPQPARTSAEHPKKAQAADVGAGSAQAAAGQAGRADQSDMEAGKVSP